MKISFTSQAINQEAVDCLILGVYKSAELTPQGKILDKASNHQLTQIMRTEGFTGECGQCVSSTLFRVEAKQILLVGLGEKKEVMDAWTLNKVLSSVFKYLKSKNMTKIACYLTDCLSSTQDRKLFLRNMVIYIQNALYAFERYKSKKSKISIKQVFLFVDKTNKVDKAAVKEGESIAQAMAFARQLGDEPPNVCTPAYLETEAKALAKRYPKIKTQVLNKAALLKHGMGGLLAVGQGSEVPPRLISMEYQAGKKTEKPIVFVGKGITFDSGGLSLKPAQAMEEMKWDMMGAATVFGIMHAIATLNLPINVVGLVPTAENMPGGPAYRPGDVIKTFSGQTVEVVNTDAEGRLILCDALTYAARYKPKTVIDIATLTGAIIVSLGFGLSGIFSNNDPLARALVNAGEASGDKAWQMPLVEDYQSELNSSVADMTNCGSRWGGSITAACFLSRFTREYQWAHIDNAGTGFSSAGGVENKGATGRPIPLLLHYLLSMVEKA